MQEREPLRHQVLPVVRLPLQAVLDVALPDAERDHRVGRVEAEGS